MVGLADLEMTSISHSDVLEDNEVAGPGPGVRAIYLINNFDETVLVETCYMI